jgi:hypothetical protein
VVVVEVGTEARERGARTSYTSRTQARAREHLNDRVTMRMIFHCTTLPARVPVGHREMLQDDRHLDDISTTDLDRQD